MTQFNRKKYREIVADYFEPKLSIFWRDFLFAYILFIGGLAALLLAEPVWVNCLGFVMAVFMAYRCSSYIHEIVHLPKTKFKHFISAWNNLIGLPFLMPSFLYESHLDHHLPRKYGTVQDPEYLVMAGSGFFGVVGFIAHHALLTPLVLYIRMLLGLPARLLAPKLSDKFDRYFSSLVINFQYDASNRTKKSQLMALEAYVVAVTAIMGTLIAFGYVPATWILLLVSVIMTALVMNAIRTLGAHRYANKKLEAVNAKVQLVDSLNYGGPAWIGLLMAPVGLRYHALHHLFPNMPYHSLHQAHYKLIAELDSDDVYHKTVFTSFVGQMVTLMKQPEQSLEELAGEDAPVEAS